jgi:hypothetical protein
MKISYVVFSEANGNVPVNVSDASSACDAAFADSFLADGLTVVLVKFGIKY